MKKLSMLLAALFSFSFLLTACGGEDTTSTESLPSLMEDPAAVVEYLHLVDISNALVFNSFPIDGEGTPVYDIELAELTDQEMESFALALSMYTTPYYVFAEGESFASPEDDLDFIIIPDSNVQAIVSDVFGVADFRGPTYDEDLSGYLFPSSAYASDIMMAHVATTVPADDTIEMELLLFYLDEEGRQVHLGTIGITYKVVTEGNRMYAQFVKSALLVEGVGVIEANPEVPENSDAPTEEADPSETDASAETETSTASEAEAPASTEESETAEDSTTESEAA